MTKDETEGRIRAIEAVLLHLPEISPSVMQAAKAWIRNPKRQPDLKVAEVKLQISGRLDEHAEKALDELTTNSKNSKASTTNLKLQKESGPRLRKLTTSVDVVLMLLSMSTASAAALM